MSLDLIIPRELECFASMDWGRLRPGCFAWWMVLPAEPDTRYHIIAERKFAGLDDEEIADVYHEQNKFLGLSPKYIAADPSMWIADGRDAKRGQSRAETMSRALMPMRKALNDRKAGWVRVARFLRVPKDEHGIPTGEPPILTIDEACPYLIRTIPAQRSAKTEPEDVDTNGDDHGADTVRYGAASRPMPALRWQAPIPPKGTAGYLLNDLRSRLGQRPVLGAGNVRGAA